MSDRVLTVKEEIMTELIKSTKPLLVEEIARRVGRSRSAINSNMTDLNKAGRVTYLGKEYGWQAAKVQPPGLVRGTGRIKLTTKWPSALDKPSETSSSKSSEPKDTSIQLEPSEE